MEKVFITGADGMLGSSICREAIRQGYVVKAMCLSPETTLNISTLDIEIVYGNILDKERLLVEMKGCDIVIHIAAITTVWPRRNIKVNEVNIEGTKNVMEAIEVLGIKKMIHIGSAGSFGHGSIKDPGNENSHFEGWEYGMDYIESKYQAQNMLIRQHKESGLPVVIINPTFMIGPFDSGPSSGKMLLGFYNNDIPGYSAGGKNFVCSTDVAIAAVNAIQLGKTGECYIAGHQNLTFKEFFKIASEVTGKKFNLKPVPQVLILLAGAFNSLMARLSGWPPALSYGMARMSKINQYYSCEKAVRELRMPQTPIHVGIRQCMDWFSANGYLE